MNLTKFSKHIGSDDQGATAIEYGLILSLIVIGLIVGLQVLAAANSSQWQYVMDEVVKAMGG